MKRRKFSIKKFALFLIVLIICIFVSVFGIYKFQTGAPSSSKKAVEFEIAKGDTYSNISSKLKKEDLIKSELFYRLFIKINKPNGLMAGTYKLNKNMNVSELVKALGDEKNQVITTVTITFREGLNVRQMASIINKKTNITEEEFLNKISDENYIDTLKEKYWFITDDVKNKQIYYDLEGYLFPDTYVFDAKNLTLDSILEGILKNTDKKLSEVKDQITNSNYSVHQILTLASLIEQEAVTDDDRANVAGVFYNRLNNNWALGSDVTTYYAAKKSMKEKLTKAEIEQRVNEIPFKGKVTAIGSYTKKRLRAKRLAVIAAILAVIIALFGIIAVSSGKDSSELLRKLGYAVIEMFGGETAEYGNITLNKSNETKNNINQLIQ